MTADRKGRPVEGTSARTCDETVSDARLAEEPVKDVAPVLSERYRQVVEQMRSDAGIRRMIEHGMAAITPSAASAHVTRQLFGRSLSSDMINCYRKANGELVSVGERLARQAIRQRLIRERLDDGYEGEETGALDGHSRRRRLDDPVDGTVSMLKMVLAEAYRCWRASPITNVRPLLSRLFPVAR